VNDRKALHQGKKTAHTPSGVHGKREGEEEKPCEGQEEISIKEATGK